MTAEDASPRTGGKSIVRKDIATSSLVGLQCVYTTKREEELKAESACAPQRLEFLASHTACSFKLVFLDQLPFKVDL